MARLLIIDDNQAFRETLAAALAWAGHTVLQAGDGREGVAMLGGMSVDLVITDIIMPEQEGLETIHGLRRERPGLPIIAMSGDLLRSALYLDMARKLGAAHLLTKPFPPTELLRLIDELVGPPKPPGAA